MLTEFSLGGEIIHNCFFFFLVLLLCVKSKCYLNQNWTLSPLRSTVRISCGETWAWNVEDLAESCSFSALGLSFFFGKKRDGVLGPFWLRKILHLVKQWGHQNSFGFGSDLIGSHSLDDATWLKYYTFLEGEGQEGFGQRVNAHEVGDGQGGD